VARKLKVPFGVVINRDGIGDGRVDDWCKNEKIPVIIRVPNSLEVARLYSKGIPPAIGIPDLKERFVELLKVVEGWT
jgi:MinD superfamily P-loop ATPase